MFVFYSVGVCKTEPDKRRFCSRTMIDPGVKLRTKDGDDDNIFLRVHVCSLHHKAGRAARIDMHDHIVLKPLTIIKAAALGFGKCVRALGVGS
jgi:hypothetical protein